jgi:oligosaccharide repeat unit polymerase
MKINKIANPNILFILIWVSVIYLHSLHTLDIYLDINHLNISFIYINIIFAFFLLLYQLIYLKDHNYTEIIKRKIKKNYTLIDAYIKKLLIVYFIISLLDIIYSSGIPIFWTYMGIDKDYTLYGIPTLHGLANGIVFFTLSLMYSFKLLLKDNKYNKYIVLIFLWQILILSRGVIMVSTIQLLCLYLLFTKQTKSKWVIISFVIFSLILAFGYLGDIRQGSNPYYGLLKDSWLDLFQTLPSGFLWVYVYFTSGFNNLIYNTNIIYPNYLPYYSFSKLLPSIFYNLIGIAKSSDAFEFVKAGLNVSTIYAGFYSDYGYLCFIPVLLIQYLSFKFYRGAISGSLSDSISYAVFFQAILLSFFTDTILYLPFIVQFYFTFKLKKYDK